MPAYVGTAAWSIPKEHAPQLPVQGGEALVCWIDLAAGAARAGRTTWCIFDNTALGFATANALQVRAALAASGLV